MPRITIETPAGVVGDAKAAFMAAGFAPGEAEDMQRRLLDGTRCWLNTSRFVRRGVDLGQLLTGLRQAGFAVRFSGIEPGTVPGANG